LNTVGMPYYKENLLSSWPSHLVFEVGAPPPKIDTAIFNNMSRTEMGFFAKNPRTRRRNQAESRRQSDRVADSLSAPKFLSEQSRAVQPYNSEADGKTTETMESLTDLHLEDVTRKEVPSMYGNVEIKYSKFGVDDFDFAYGHIIHVGCRLANLVAVTTIKRLTLGWRHILRIRTPTRYCSYCALPL
jgi:PAB-dependent poly(A)-specific ribonuclease subunit 2